MTFSGLGVHMGNLSLLSQAQTRSISPENLSGAKGSGGMSTDGPAADAARALGKGWKVSPYVLIEPGETFVLADIEGSGAVQHIWMTLGGGKWRHAILRSYWDDQNVPSIECPVGDFFACGWERFAQVNSLAVCVNPGCGFNCYWDMPFRRRAQFTMQNLSDETITVYYQITYALAEVPDDAAFFHAQFRRVNPVPYEKVYTILSGVKGQGHYVGTYLAWGSNNSGWWGEGEVKFYLDGDTDFPTICGTGTEDYFGGAYNFDPGAAGADAPPSAYREFSTSYAGLPQVISPDGVYLSQQRFGMYRWHIADPVRFQRELRITIQALGWRTHRNRQYLPLQDDIASVGYWYQALPTQPFPTLPNRNYLEVI